MRSDRLRFVILPRRRRREYTRTNMVSQRKKEENVFHKQFYDLFEHSHVCLMMNLNCLLGL